MRPSAPCLSRAGSSSSLTHASVRRSDTSTPLRPVTLVSSSLCPRPRDASRRGRRRRVARHRGRDMPKRDATPISSGCPGSVRTGRFSRQQLDHTPDAAAAQGRQGGLAAWPHWLWLSTRLPRANASGHPTTCRRRTAPPGSSSALGSASAAACGWSQRGGLRHFGRRNRSTSTPPRAPLPVTRQSSRRPGGALG